MNGSINNRFFLLILTAQLVIFLGATGSAQQNETVDQKLVKRIDVTGDRIDDEIILHIKGENWNKPFKWTLAIVSGGKTVFEHKSDDTWLDAFFNDKGYVNDTCASYLECKKQYYLNNLLKYLTIKTDLSPNIHAYDQSNSGSIHTVARKELMDKFHLSEAEAIKTVDWMIRKLKTKETSVLYVLISPGQSEFPRMFVDRVGKFVTIYEW